MADDWRSSRSCADSSDKSQVRDACGQARLRERGLVGRRRSGRGRGGRQRRQAPLAELGREEHVEHVRARVQRQVMREGREEKGRGPQQRVELLAAQVRGTNSPGITVVKSTGIAATRITNVCALPTGRQALLGVV